MHTIASALGGLHSNKFRALVTTVRVVIGVDAVIAHSLDAQGRQGRVWCRGVRLTVGSVSGIKVVLWSARDQAIKIGAGRGSQACWRPLAGRGQQRTGGRRPLS